MILVFYDIMSFLANLKIFVFLIIIFRNSDCRKHEEVNDFSSNSSFKNETINHDSKDSGNKINLLFQYFKPRNECNFESESNNTLKNCPHTSDYLFCFPSTPVNSTIYLICPYIKIPINRNIKAKRYCQLNGTWASTDFSSCVEYLVHNINSGICKIKKNIDKKTSQIEEELECDSNKEIDAKIFKLMTILNFIGFLITIFFVSFAIFVFLSIR